MALEINRLGGALGAEVRGLNLSEPLGGNLLETVRQAFIDHSVLVFRDQTLSPEQLITFSGLFGESVPHLLEGFQHEENPNVFLISNVQEDGKPKGAIYAGQYWHSDLSYMPLPALGSMLNAVEIPKTGGDTMFANMYLAYETLSDTMKKLIADLQAVHDYTHAYETVFSKLPGRPPMTEAEKSKVPPVTHPIVRTHPDSGRKALYVILNFLFAHATRPEFIYRHQWQPRDLVFWDNRCLMHRAVADYDMAETRHMHRATIQGDAPHS
jgi:taurine dioxygenase